MPSGWIAVNRHRLLRAVSVLAAALSLTPVTTLARETEYFRLDELLRSEEAREVLKAPVALYWNDQPAPEFVEKTELDRHSGTAISGSPFGGSRRHCVEGFDLALKAMVNEAVRLGYDAIAGIRVVIDGKPSDDPVGFYCMPGHKVTTIRLEAAFLLTRAGQERLAAEEAFVPVGPPRPPADGAIYLPLAPILESPEMKSIIGSDISIYWQGPPPEYGDRYGPEAWYDHAEIARYGKDDVCRQAAFKVLLAMADKARAEEFDSIIKLRSYLNGQFTPDPGDIECEIGRKIATVKLRAMLVKRKP
jgi:hypothetical protein